MNLIIFNMVLCWFICLKWTIFLICPWKIGSLAVHSELCRGIFQNTIHFLFWLIVYILLLIAVRIIVDCSIFVIFKILLYLMVTLKLWILISFTCHSMRSLDVERHSRPCWCIWARSLHRNKLMLIWLSLSIFKSKSFLLILYIYLFICIIFIVSYISIKVSFLYPVIIILWSVTISIACFALVNNCWVFAVHHVCLARLYVNFSLILRCFFNLRKYFIFLQTFRSFLIFLFFRFTASFIWRNTSFVFVIFAAWMQRLLWIFCNIILLFRIIDRNFCGFLWF